MNQPSTSPASRPCIFLDRDGVINAAPPSGEYVLAWDQLHIIPEIVDWIRLFNLLGYLVIVVTNQRCITRKLISQAEVESIHQRLAEALAGRGARIDDFFTCPHGDGECDCRKPQPGMIRAATAKWNIDLKRSVMIGDSWRDRDLAEAVGIPIVTVKNGHIINLRSTSE